MSEKKQDNLKTMVLDLKDLVLYQDGSVVSRMVVYKPAGTITLFAFDAKEGLSEHTAPFDAIATIMEGEAEITIGDKEFHLTTGQMIIMPAGIPHAVRAVQRFKMMLTMIHS
jgi:quercetin dioxygenase-like cupin family protein